MKIINNIIASSKNKISYFIALQWKTINSSQTSKIKMQKIYHKNNNNNNIQSNFSFNKKYNIINRVMLRQKIPMETMLLHIIHIGNKILGQ